MTRHALLSPLWLLLLLLASLAQAAESDRGLIWKVEGAAKPSYLLGSIHLAPPSLYALPKTVTEAFAAADALVVEVDLLSADAMKLGRLTAERGIYPAGQSLRQEIGDAEWAALERALRRYGYSPQFADRQRPWLVQMSLAAAAFMAEGYDQNAGLDLHFLPQAKAEGMPVRELETAESQLALLSGFPPALQRRMLAHTVRQLLEEEIEIGELAESWRRGDAAALGEVVMREFGGFPEVEAALVHERNAAMAARLRGWLKDGRSYFIVTGAAHMLGESGLAAALRRAGYKVNQL